MYYIIRFLGRQNKGLSPVYAILGPWIRWQEEKVETVVVAYPEEPWVVTMERVKGYENPQRIWDSFLARIKGCSVVMSMCQPIYSFDYFSQDCCKAHDSVNLGFICDDGKYAPFTGCCGVGSCNLACCQCTGGCRAGPYAGGENPFGWPSASIPLTGGVSGVGAPAAAGDFAKEAGKVVGGSTIKFGYAAGKDIYNNAE